jgi:ATP-dependent Lon protease
MTGEITLRGRVLPVGGIKEKILAAMSHGVRRVFLPARNAHDLEEIPKELRRRVEVILVNTIDEIWPRVLGEPQK